MADSSDYAERQDWNIDRVWVKHSERIADHWEWHIEDRFGTLARLADDVEMPLLMLMAAAPEMFALLKEKAGCSRKYVSWRFQSEGFPATCIGRYDHFVATNGERYGDPLATEIRERADECFGCRVDRLLQPLSGASEADS